MNDAHIEYACLVDVLFTKAQRPRFGDLFLICGYENPNFPPRDPRWASLGDLQFEQVDDYFAVRVYGDEPVIWLYPLVAGAEVHHHPGPFDGLRLTYVPELHSEERAAHFAHAVDGFSRSGAAEVRWGRAAEPVGPPVDTVALTTRVRRFVDAGAWREGE
ncbi:hypothetical protein [Streptomyces aidingensis]|uniref:Uncharacterized protein n=1 Tax=Streptomyces aidingensis TaxID=910347 RepID=A0A1I1E3M3_9ACTN|nr:hypothetical protein [Streptomyces aidingensis]SFB81771.1 hypothetical protein SAMN05421773_101111 [Streptomyces aidingensis]